MKKIQSITTEMAEYVCDEICKQPYCVEQEELVKICAECKMGQFICDILKTVEVQDDD